MILGSNIFASLADTKRKLPKLFTWSLLAAAAIVMSSMGSLAHAEMIDGIIAVVDDQVIMYSDLDKKLNGLGAKADDDKAARQVLQLMIEDIIVKKVYQSFGFPQVDLKQAEDVASQMNIDVPSAKAFIMKSTLMDVMVRSRVVVTEAMVRSYYEGQKQYTGKESVHLKQILIRNDPDKVRQVLEEIRKGTTFDEAAKKFSDVLISDSPDIGWVAVGDLAEQVRKELEAAKPGEVVGPVTMDDNSLIYQVVERGMAGGKPIEEVRTEITETLQEQYRKEAFEHWLKMIMADHYIGFFM